jgi:RNA polymerase sigma-70 factor (ECF subfamily)
MSIKNTKNPVNSPQIIPFPVENPKPQLSINIDDADIRLFHFNFYPMVFRRCMAILRNKENAKEMADAVFEKIQRLKSEGRLHIDYPKTYLSTMAKNMSINEKKRASSELKNIRDMATNESLIWFKNKREHDQEAWEAGIIDNGYEQVEAEIIVKAILAEQDETTNKIYLLKYFHDKTLEEIGKIVGLKKSAVHKRIKVLERQVRDAFAEVKE